MLQKIAALVALLAVGFTAIIALGGAAAESVDQTERSILEVAESKQ